MLMSFVSQEQCKVRSILPNLATPGGAVSRQTVQLRFALVLQPEAK